jgi:hypothetical protein
VREFITIRKHQSEYSGEYVEHAVRSTVELGASHLDEVRLCLRQRLPSHNLSDRPSLASLGHQPVNLQQYDQLLGGR